MNILLHFIPRNFIYEAWILQISRRICVGHRHSLDNLRHTFFLIFFVSSDTLGTLYGHACPSSGRVAVAVAVAVAMSMLYVLLRSNVHQSGKDNEP